MSDQPDPITNDDGEPLTFEQAIGRLEQLIDAIESGDVGLEESLNQYEHGVKLLAQCRTILDRAEQKIEQLNVTEDGELEEAE